MVPAYNDWRIEDTPGCTFRHDMLPLDSGFVKLIQEDDEQHLLLLFDVILFQYIVELCRHYAKLVEDYNPSHSSNSNLVNAFELALHRLKESEGL
jgi:hypothetical protein